MRNWRINLILIIFFVFSATIISRLIYIQIIKHQYWQAMAQGQQKSFVELQGERGDVLFQDKTDLATNQDLPMVYAVPAEVKNKEEASAALSSVLNLDKNDILDKFQENNLYAPLKKKLTDEESNKIKDLNLAGIYLSKETNRYYPFNNLASQVIGFFGGDNKGQYGVEGYYDDILQGKQEAKELERGPAGFLSNSAELTINDSSSKGSDIVLTIDYNIQFMAEKLLAQAKTDLDFEGAEIIVTDPNSGKILAMADSPSFDPNNYAEVRDPIIFQNSCIQKIFEPGSIFKPVTMAVALDEGKIAPQTKFVDDGNLVINGHHIQNFANKIWGERTMTEVLQWSINTGAVFAEQQLAHQDFLNYLEKFGFFDKTGIDLQGEVASGNQELKNGRDINFATAGFGQGIAVTSIQLVKAFGAIANGGKLLKPYVVDKIVEGDKITETQPKVQNASVISQNTASQVTMMMINVVENGYGKEAGVAGYYIAGKTGTAQVPYSALGIDKIGYSDETVQSFIGFGPALNPKFLIFIKLYNPKASTAEYSAAPIFGNLAKYIIDLRHIPPDHE